MFPRHTCMVCNIAMIFIEPVRQQAAPLPRHHTQTYRRLGPKTWNGLLSPPFSAALTI
jgi:hypothetical protein